MDKLRDFTFEKSIVSNKPLKKGSIISENDLAFKKPQSGISASEFKSIIGLTLTKTIEKDHVFQSSDLVK